MENFLGIVFYGVIFYLVIKNNKEKKKEEKEQQNENCIKKHYNTQSNEIKNTKTNNNLVKSSEFVKILNKLENKQKNNEIIKTSNYYKKNKLLTPNEKLFYKVIKEAVKEKEIIIQTQVVLYEVINVKNNSLFYSNFNKIKSKSIDFVLVDYDFNILVCIELDDTTHNRPDRIQRDEFINQLFRETNTRLIRVPAQPYYNVERIRKLIEECI